MASQQVIFFGGQGGRSSGYAPSTITLKGNENSHCLTLLLSACHSIFLEEAFKARKGSNAPAWARFDVFPSPERLLVLSPEESTNPILQGVSLCLNQLLTYLNYDCDLQNPEPVAIMGFCSGMLPAVVVACSESLDEYIAYSKEAIRAAFWVGYRAAELSSNIGGRQWNELPWAMSVSGKTREVLMEEIVIFNQTSKKTTAHEVIILANIFGEKGFSIVGPGYLLEQFRSRYHSENTAFALIPVHALYHAGENSASALEAVLTDLNTDRCAFPSRDKLKRPLWSCHNGGILNAAGPDQNSLLQCILTCILVEQADLLTTWNNMVKEMELSNSSWSAITIGDGARALLSTVNKDVHSSSKHSFIDLPRLPMNSNSGSCNEFAVVGMSVNFPSGLGKAQFWNMLELGLNAAQEIPGTRFCVDDYQVGKGQHGSKREMKIQHGNFINNPFSFDHEFFNISPRESKSMDPQQKLLLQGAVSALDDAGYVPYSTPSYNPETMACYVGIATEDYVQNLNSEIDVYYSTGTLRAFLSGKISYAFGWSGPSVVIDTACSSSTVAILNACRALAAGDCSAALAGGANVITSPDMYIGLSRAHFLSSTGQCRPFDAGADGYCRSEGCGLFVIKRLEDAVREHDRIYGVIKGIEINQSGNATSITHPHAETQQKLFQKVLTSSGIDPATISVVEAHGTGTQAGDGTEASSLMSVFGGLSSIQSVYLTSIKGNIGHAEAASGAASLAKLLLMLQNRTIPPQVGLKRLNPKLERLMAQNFHISTQAIEWKPPRNIPRRALLNNFGAAGSNATLIVEEYERRTPMKTRHEQRSTYMFILSAKTEQALRTLINRHKEFLQKNDQYDSIANICYTVTARRRLYVWRLSLAVSSSKDLLKQLNDEHSINQCVESIGSPVTFVFSGQGGFYAGMAKSLLSTSSLFRDKVTECDQILKLFNLPSVIPILEGLSSPDSKLDFILWSQIASFVLEYAVAFLWLSWGVKPDLVIGHSLGEYAAMAFTEALSLKDSLGMIVRRAQLMVELCQCGQSGMLACESSVSFIGKIFASDGFQNLSIACDNGPTSCVVSGPNQDLDRLAQILRSQAVRCKSLDVAIGFHSDALEPIMKPLEEHCRDFVFHAPKFPMGSCLHGRLLDSSELEPSYIVQQTRGTVRFKRLLESLREARMNSGIFIEIGPHPITLPMINSMFRDDGCLSLASIAKNEDAWATLCSSLREISDRGIPIRWREVFDGTDATVTDVPEYPFKSHSHYIPFSEMRHQTDDIAKQVISAKPNSFELLDSILYEMKSELNVPSKFSTELASLSKYILGHVVGEFPLCPASVYIECVLEAAHWDDKFNKEFVLTVHNIDFGLPLLYSEERLSNSIDLTFENGVPTYDQISETRITRRKFTFTQSVSSEPSHSPKKNSEALCSGWAEWENVKDIEYLFSRSSAYIRRQIAHLQGRETNTNVFRPKALYQLVFPRVVSYGEEFQTIKELKVLEDGLEAHGTFKIPPISSKGGILTPVFVDTLLHAAGFVANSYIQKTEACICAKVESIKVFYQDLDLHQTFQVYTSLLECNNGVLLGEAYAVTLDGTVVGTVEGMHFKKLNLKSFKAHLSRQLLHDTPNQVSLQVKGNQQKPNKQKDDDFVVTRKEPQPKQDMNVPKIVLETICQICERPLNSIRGSSTLLSLGIDSMMRIELGNLLAKKLTNVDLDMDHMTEIDTISQLQEYIIEKAAKSEPYTSSASDIAHDSSIGNSSTPADTPFSGLSSQSQTPPVAEGLHDLYHIINQTCEIPLSKISPEIALESLGMDSLMAIELQEALQQHFGQSLPENNPVSNWTVQDLIIHLGLNKHEDYIKSLQDINQDTSFSMLAVTPVLTHLQNGDPSLPPLILFHDGSGTMEYYKKLKNIGSNVYAIMNPILKEDHWAKSLTDMAHQYASAISTTIEGPFILGGWSFGGVLSHAVAQCLERLDEKVLAVIMIDSPCPENLEPLPSAIVKYVLGQKNLSYSTELVITAQFQKHAQFLAEYSSQRSATQGFIAKERKYFMIYCQDTLNTSKICGVDHPWLSDKNCREQALNQWEQILGRSLTVLRIPGNHFQVFDSAYVDVVSQQLQQAYTAAI
ncbi:polyketide synthase, putative [Talaromyces stipitatus ATCC 10500]|uniref:Polyketide synthase, putative n=1 Tax=Talaromyces stipitatus (strain ATCC 10500 / CBS 375.48 / QM 6759 / NRRL 1006) TaxID=441959 RepID=B8MPT9_TALSN|nr:polyketide synthase, putative [Talaromyces stipitatus ATCC 10500]EED12747.1 polyketide synthase, putative [Talaromyces stipitatus ATCC 10500]